MLQKCSRASCWFALLLVLTGGCGKTPVFNDLVEGAATLDGKPLGNAHILFVPDEPDIKAPSSTGITDENGHFQLNREDGEPGALVGGTTRVVIQVLVHTATPRWLGRATHPTRVASRRISYLALRRG